MKRILPFYLAALLVLAAFAPLTVRAETITLKVADNLPPKHFLAASTKWFMDEVTRRTNGQVKFDYYPAEQLGKMRDMPSLVSSSVADIGLIGISNVSETLPLSGVAELPNMYTTACQGSLAFYKAESPGGFLYKNELQPAGFRIMFAYVNPPFQLFLRKPSLTGLADVKGLKLRAIGGALEQVVRDLGAVPVALTAPEIYEALSRGTIDGLTFPPPTIIAYSLDPLIKSATIGESFGGAATGYMMSARRWESLPKNVQDVFNQVGLEATRRACSSADGDVQAAYDKFRGEGVNIVRFSKRDHDDLNKVLSQAVGQWAASMEQRGKPGNAAIKAFAADVASGKR